MDFQGYIQGLINNDLDWDALMAYSPALFWATVAGAFVFAAIVFIAQCRIFKKANQNLRVLRALIPIVNTYTEFKISWGRAKFWSVFFLLLVSTALIALTIAVPLGSGAAALLIIAAIVLAIIAMILCLIQRYKFAKCFGHGFGFFLGLLFFPIIFYLLLGYGRSEYKGVQR